MGTIFSMILNTLLIFSSGTSTSLNYYYDDSVNQYLNDDAKSYYMTFPETPIGFFDKTSKIARRNMVEEWNIAQPAEEPEY